MNEVEYGMLRRTELLLGREAVGRIQEQRIIIFGIGGVGSWTAESLVRTGVRRLTIVDADKVCLSNVNRQLMATSQTVGQEKVEALKERLLSLNPVAEITALAKVYAPESAAEFHIEDYDYVIDCIDSLACKAHLILNATSLKKRLYSSMGAALKLDPTRVKVAEFWKVEGCPLAAALRNRFRRAKEFPSAKFKCVYSDEHLENKGEHLPDNLKEALSPTPMNYNKVQTNGSLAHITAIFGFTLAGLVLQDICKNSD